MKNKNSDIINKAIDSLSESKSYQSIYHQPKHDELMPSIPDLRKIVNLLKEILFPWYFGNTTIKPKTLKYYIGVNIDKKRSVNTTTCPPIIRDIGAIFVPYSPKIISYAIQNYTMHNDNDNYHYKDSVYKSLNL